MNYMNSFYFNLLFSSSIFISYAWRPPIIWKEGINWVQMVVGIGVPVNIKDATITIGSAAKAYYLLPTNTSYSSYTTYERSGGPSFLRQKIYAAVEDILQRHGLNDGKSCLLKLICEYSKNEIGRNSLISKVIDIILRPSSSIDATGENIYFSAEKMGLKNMDCNYLFPECKNDLLNTVLRKYVT